MFSQGKPAGYIAGARRTLILLSLLSIGHVLVAPLLAGYWLSENNGPPLAPGKDFRPKWISDVDFRGLDAETGPVYAAPGGRATYAAGEAWQLFRPNYVASPDGKWHVEVLARGPLTPYALRAYALAAVPSVVFGVFGLVICFFALRADSTSSDLE